MKNKLLVISFLIVLMFTGCGKKDAEQVVSEPEIVDETDMVEEVEPTEPEETLAVEEEAVAEDVPLTQEELDKLNAEATTDAQKEALDAYETITKEGTWTDAYGVTYTEVVGKPDGSWRRMTDAEAEKTLETAGITSDEYYYAQAELQGKDYVEYDTVTGIVYYDPYKFVEAIQPVLEESRRKNEAGGDVVSEEEIRQILGDEAAKELFGI